MPEITPNPFLYIKPNYQSVAQLGILGGACKDVYDMILKYIPDCRERALAITKLQEVRMWANCAIVMTQARAEAEKT